jgi:hypothetical protein
VSPARDIDSRRFMPAGPISSQSETGISNPDVKEFPSRNRPQFQTLGKSEQLLCPPAAA